MSTSSAGFNAQIIEEFHANQGRVGGIFEGVPLLLLHHFGAKSDKNRINPLGYQSDGGRYVVCASNGGAPRNPDWYYNLKAHPNVTIEVGTDTIPVQASEASGEERDRLFRTSVERAPQLGEYEKQAGRTIPVIVLTPTETG
jgi:deazaflavin-dependent oxidoreductase (nitroreductase family)